MVIWLEFVQSSHPVGTSCWDVEIEIFYNTSTCIYILFHIFTFHFRSFIQFRIELFTQGMVTVKSDEMSRQVELPICDHCFTRGHPIPSQS